MTRSNSILLTLLVMSAAIATKPFLIGALLAAQSGHSSTHGHSNHADKVRMRQLLPADGASVKITSPKKEQIFHSDQIPLHFSLIKGKRGHHVHAYVNGELMGMFNSEKGTLTGLKPGKHVLELRVVAEDHTKAS